MDNVRLGMDEPQEDEYALYRMTTFSPLERLVFPKSVAFFLNDYEPIPTKEKDLSIWEEKLTSWFKKLTLQSGKTIISKNPFNSWRIKELSKLFPNARFIHIYRNPVKVVPSAIHMWKIVHKQNCLNSLGKAPCTEDVISILDNLLQVIRQDSTFLDKEKFYEMRFEDLEKDPVHELTELYRAFGLKQDNDLAQRIDEFLKENNNFQKNTYPLSNGDEALIRRKLQHHMEYFNYE